MALLAELHAAGATICIVTHDPRFAEHAQRVVYLLDGCIVDEATARHAGETVTPLRGLTAV